MAHIPFIQPRLVRHLGNHSPDIVVLANPARQRDRVRAVVPNPRRKKLVVALVDEPEFNMYSILQKRFNRSVQRSTAALVVALMAQAVYPPAQLVAILILLSGGPLMFAQRAWETIRKERRLDTNLIMSLSIFVTIFSGYVVFSALISIVAAGALSLTMRVKGETQSQLINVFKQQPLFVWILDENGEEVQVPFKMLAQGDVVVISSGNVIPADGTIIDGSAAVDQHALTGESQPAEKEIGDEVLASTVVLRGKLHVRVDRAGRDTTVAQIGQVLNATLRNKSEVELKAERLIDRTVAPTVAVSALLLPVLGPPASVAILVAHFRKRPAFFASISLLNYFRILSDNQIFVKDGRSMDDVYEVDTVVFDKTGTLTVTQPQVATIHSVAQGDEIAVLRYAAAAEDRQHHPIALAILEYARDNHIDVPPVDEAHYQLGFGLDVQVEGRRVRVGSRRFMDREGVQIPDQIAALESQSHEDGHSMVMVALDDDLIGAVELVPTVREEASAVIEQLRQMGVKETIIVSGDHERPTRKLARDLGIDRYFAQKLPQEKAEIIQQLVDEGRVVCYVGDGINDAIALQAAQVSVSISGASTVATDAAQVILTGGDLRDLPVLFAYGKEYSYVSKAIIYGLIGAGVVGMAGAVLPFAMSFAFWSANISLVGGLLAAMAPYGIYQYRKLNRRHILPEYQRRFELGDGTESEQAPRVIIGEARPKNLKNAKARVKKSDQARVKPVS